ncbi:MAG: 2-C-methyl-D-erythritol 4-phosphate cytidylyltransferase [Bacteroidetes bacterium]|nr:2-C-methyl-D-erythritol 4-phosphate cytidylyltransferase [Bacteroidota bacterium]
MDRYVILVAGGRGTRMQGSLPKQFLLLQGEPILVHTLRKFSLPGFHVIVVMNPDFMEYWEDQCKISLDIPKHQLIAGGQSRAQSVANGLAQIPENCLVAIHDAVRPLCSTDLIYRLFKACEMEGSAIPVVACKDSLRLIMPEGSKSVNRENYKAVQTPQVFHSKKIKDAFSSLAIETFTDEASVYEAAGNKVHLVEGEESNIKITVPSDIQMATAFLALK